MPEIIKLLLIITYQLLRYGDNKRCPLCKSRDLHNIDCDLKDMEEWAIKEFVNIWTKVRR